MTLGKRLKRWRERCGLTQREAADAAGVSQGYWAVLELDRAKRVGLDVAQRLVVVLGGEISLADFPRRRGKSAKAPAESSSLVEDAALHARAG